MHNQSARHFERLANPSHAGWSSEGRQRRSRFLLNDPDFAICQSTLAARVHLLSGAFIRLLCTPAYSFTLPGELVPELAYLIVCKWPREIQIAVANRRFPKLRNRAHLLEQSSRQSLYR